MVPAQMTHPVVRPVLAAAAGVNKETGSPGAYTLFGRIPDRNCRKAQRKIQVVLQYRMSI